ncbi:hypothetical protein C4J89_5138 [Pseudomonas sp. R4-35-07]|nr:hypothetical protein C4J89_5138 [Pseudomonas sp. R4-35-07]
MSARLSATDGVFIVSAQMKASEALVKFLKAQGSNVGGGLLPIAVCQRLIS